MAMSEMSEQEAIYWFIGKYENPPLRENGSIDYEFLCGEFLVEGETIEEVKEHYNALPDNLKY
jgi:hypothetical protein